MITERETEVLHLTSKGICKKDIARELVVSAHAVQAHLANSSNELGVGPPIEAVLHTLRRG